MTKNMGMECLHGPVERSTKASGLREFNMAKALLLMQKESKRKLSGSKAP